VGQGSFALSLLLCEGRRLARKILLADDSVTAQNMGRKILADAGYDVVTVNNGSAALKRITEIKPDLIVLDVYMPGYSGLEVCQRLKDAPETSHIPVLLTVGKLEPFKPEEARRAKADAHIVKPFEASELLTAITKLEDRMVPQQSDGSRFSTSVSGVERFGGDGGSKRAASEGEADSGWKSRLRFPSKKKKEEPEPEAEDPTAGAPFRDFRKGKGRSGAAFTVKASPPPGQEPGLVPDIPRDITPEELDALSALAAKLDGPIPEAENIAPLAEKMGPVLTPAEVDVAKTEAAPAAEVPSTAGPAQTETAPEAQPGARVEAKAEETTEAQTVEKTEQKIEEKAAPKEEMAAPAPAAAVPEFVVEAPAAEIKDAVAIPVETTEAAPEPVAEVPAAVVFETVNPAALAEEPAPVDRADEPMFEAASVVEPVTEQKRAEEEIEEKPPEPVAQAEVSAAVEVVPEAITEPKAEEPPVETVELKAEFSQAETRQVEQPPAEPAALEEGVPPVAVAASVPEPVATEQHAPSDEELAEALRLLTPSSSTNGSTVPSHGTLVAAGQLLAEEAARNAAEGTRWMAEPVALSAEEATLSLEEEMFRSFASAPAVKTRASIEAPQVTGVSAIAAAVESRLASMDLTVGARNSAVQSSNSGSANLPAVQTPVEAVTAIVSEASAAASAPHPEPIEPENRTAMLEAGQKVSPVETAQETPVEEAPSATFADAMSREEVAAESGRQPESVSETPAGARQDSSSEIGSEASMAKDEKAKSGKSNWHQLRTAPAGAAPGSDVVEAAKQAEGAVEEAPKAMAAAAAEGSSSSSAPDAGTIASIVDSVMADLRPKIVEEIAKKFAGK
jgi:CheY-like chemotaxis protein